MSQAISNRIESRVYAQIERLATEDGKAYIRVEFSGFETLYSCDGRYRIRSADKDLPMSRAKLQEMMRDAENRSNPWDGQSSGRTVDDVDEDGLCRYFERGVEARRITFEYKDRRSALSRLGLLCPDGTLTNAAWICFADRPEVGSAWACSATARAPTSATTSRFRARSSTSWTQRRPTSSTTPAVPS